MAGGTAGATVAAGSTSTAKFPLTRAEQRMADATPMVAGTDKARDLVDDESSPQLLAASQQFLAADRAIAEIARQKQVMARLGQDAAATAQLYRAMGYDVAGAQRAATTWHARYDALATATTAVQRRVVEDSATRADERLGHLVVAREGVKADFARIAARYDVAKRQLSDANARVTVLAAQRSTALAAVQAAKGSDVALNQARLAEAGQLGSQIESLSEQLATRGATVDGTGSFVHPLDGVVTSPFGMRFHPILHYTKLHTGTDFAGGSVIKAADDGRVLMTVVSTAYGNFTVIDHGIVDGKHLTTAYPTRPASWCSPATSCARATRSASSARPGRHRPAPALRGPGERHGRRPGPVPRQALTRPFPTAGMARRRPRVHDEAMRREHEVGPSSELTPGTVTGAGPYAVGNAGGELFAVSRRCRHLGADLATGSLDAEDRLVCPWHRSSYDVRTGRMVRGPQGVFAKIPGLGAGFRLLTRVLPLQRGEVVERDGCLFVR